jgi:uncharacterized hydrophobic protein (TIGR00341 family)
MAQRLLDVILPSEEAGRLEASLSSFQPTAGPWRQPLEGGLVCTRLLLDDSDQGAAVDEIQRSFGHVAGYHLLLLPVGAALPAPPEPTRANEARRTYGTRRGGLTREELSAEVGDMAIAGWGSYATVILSTIVMAIGLLRDNQAAVIGAMVIAPLLGPNVALALATTLGDAALMRRSMRANASAILMALAVSVLLGVVFPADAQAAGIHPRTGVAYSDLLLALAAGSAGALALTTGVSSALVGVMVAVALLPPTTVLGLMLGSGHWEAAGGAALLLAVNVISVNLAATATFQLHGIRPRTWWDADRARRATRTALTLDVLLVLVLAALIFLTRHR